MHVHSVVCVSHVAFKLCGIVSGDHLKGTCVMINYMLWASVPKIK